MSTATDKPAQQIGRGSFLKRPFRANVSSTYPLLLLPVVVVVVVLSCSPNYQPQPGTRPAPLGGDFVQDYAGGAIILGSDRARLYDIDHFRRIQHDAKLVGFEWSPASYYPPVYPPFFYLAVSPLSTLPYHSAVRAWGLLSAFALVVSGWLWFRFYPDCRKRFTWIWIGALIFGPTLYTFNIGHKSTFLFLLLTGTYLLLHHKRPRTAGMVFGLILFKPHLALVITAAMVWKKQWRFVSGAVITGSLLGAVSLLTGVELCADFIGVCLGAGDYVQTGGYQLGNAYSLWAFVRLLAPDASGAAAGMFASLLCCVVVAVVAMTMKGSIETTSKRFSLQFSALILATVLIGPHFYFYDLMIVLVVFFLVFSSTGIESLNATSVPVARKALFCCSVSLLLLSGFFADVAEATRIQPGVIIITAMVGMIVALTQYPALPDSARSAQAGGS